MCSSTPSSTTPAPRTRRRRPVGEVVLGVDTHRDAHVAAVLSLTEAVLATDEFPATAAGYRDLLKWARKSGAVRRAGVEGTGSYGASRSRHLLAQGVDVFDVNWMDRADRRRRGKSDPLDAQNAARAVLSGRARARAKTGDGPVQVARMYKLTKASAVKARTQAINQLEAVLVTADPVLREELAGLGNAELFRTTSAVASRARFATVGRSTAMFRCATGVRTVGRPRRRDVAASTSNYMPIRAAAPTARTTGVSPGPYLESQAGALDRQAAGGRCPVYTWNVLNANVLHERAAAIARRQDHQRRGSRPGIGSRSGTGAEAPPAARSVRVCTLYARARTTSADPTPHSPDPHAPYSRPAPHPPTHVGRSEEQRLAAVGGLAVQCRAQVHRGGRGVRRRREDDQGLAGGRDRRGHVRLGQL
ncbi:IS110 family transposase, partial [Streptomyces mirabilis]